MKDWIVSPFVHDKKFAINYLATITRDNMKENEELVESLFFDDVFNIMLQIETEDAVNVDHAYAIFGNLIEFQKTREKLTKEGYLVKVYEYLMQYIDQIYKSAEDGGII